MSININLETSARQFFEVRQSWPAAFGSSTNWLKNASHQQHHRKDQ
jgi:hypothetical protein